MPDYFKPLLSLTKSRKFYVAVAGVVVAYLTVKFGESPELTLITGVLTALGVYGATNEPDV